MQDAPPKKNSAMVAAGGECLCCVNDSLLFIFFRIVCSLAKPSNFPVGSFLLVTASYHTTDSNRSVGNSFFFKKKSASFINPTYQLDVSSHGQTTIWGVRNRLFIFCLVSECFFLNNRA